MGFRVVDKSSFSFETDLPPSSRNIHPSGVLHAFRSAHPAIPGARGREEHAFAWVTDSLHVESALDHLERHGFDRSDGIVFIPYSTKRNWMDRYPHAAPALECTERGEVVVYLNYRPYPNGLGELGLSPGIGVEGAKVVVEATAPDGDHDENEDHNAIKAPPKRKYKSRAVNMVQDNSYLPDAERDELHVEIYNYFSWLHARLAEIEHKALAAAALADAKDAGDNRTDSISEELDPVVSLDPAVLEEKRREAGKRLRDTRGVDVSKLGGVVEELEGAFSVIPNAKLEVARERQERQQQVEGKEIEGAGMLGGEGVPFLEEALGPALCQLVEARAATGGPRRRSRKKPRRKIGNPNRQYDRMGADFDVMFHRLVKYKEEHGNCLVQKGYKGDPQLANWVRGIREKKAANLKKGIEIEEIHPGEKVYCKTLTAERLERLNSIGFAWVITGPKTAWEDRFNELMEYYEANGRWPSQSMGSLGEWVHKQRTAYARRDESYMRTKAPKLDEVGFEWTPRGNTRMSWDEGFDLLMEFGRINGHFDVPQPDMSEINIDDDGKNKTSDAHRLYNWVKSLHGMYRSYKLGRQSGSLTDERVVLLIKHGFEFRND